MKKIKFILKLFLFFFAVEIFSFTGLFINNLINTYVNTNFSFNKYADNLNSVTDIISFPLHYYNIFFNSEFNNSDPNTVLYNQNYRFGKNRIINSKNKNEYHIYMIGGSTVEGDGAKNEKETIPYNLDQILKKRCSKNIYVFNEGISGYNSKNDFFNIVLRILNYQNPDLIISLQGGNDFLSYIGTENLSLNKNFKNYFWKNNWSSKEYSIVLKLNETLIQKLTHNLLNYTFTGQFLSTIVYSLQPNLYWIRGGYSNYDIDDKRLSKNYFYFQNQSKIISSKNNVKYFHFLQPYLGYTLNGHVSELNTLNGKKNTYTTNLNIPNEIFNNSFWNNFNNFYTRVKSNNNFFNQSWVFDLSDIFKNSSDIDFVDHIHLSGLGQKKVAENIYNAIIKDINCDTLK